MSPTPDSTSANLQPTFDNLQRQLAEARAERDEAERRLVERTAERDESEAQKAAMAEVLQVINSSPGDLVPVFDAMLEKATRLCEASFGQLATYDGEFFRFVAVHGETPFVEEQRARGPLPPSFGVTWSRLVSGERFVHLADLMDTDLYAAATRALAGAWILAAPAAS